MVGRESTFFQSSASMVCLPFRPSSDKSDLQSIFPFFRRPKVRTVIRSHWKHRMPLTLGQRVCLTQAEADRRGTVRYLGNLEQASDKGLWAGVEWDEPREGLHDGILNGRRLFEARSNSASFVPVAKLDEGKTAVTALTEKYGTLEEYDVGVRFGRKEVEAVGWKKTMDKVSHFDRLIHVDLTGFNVNDKELDQLAEMIKNAETLSLGRSLISSWSSIINLVERLPKLSMLDLSENRLKMDTKQSSGRIRRLVLRRNELHWEDVVRILRLFPELEEVYLAQNNISSIVDEELFQNSKLTLVDLDKQQSRLTDWKTICQLGNLPNLKVLQLSENFLDRISFPDCGPEGTSGLFPNLTQLTLRMNDITEWTSISELDKLKKLENLKIYPNKVLDSVSPATARQWVIAKVRNLKVLNQSPVSASERRDSEFDYMSQFGSEWINATRSTNADQLGSFMTQHPRFKELLDKYGPLEPGDSSQTGSQAQLKSSLIKVTLQHHEQKKEKILPNTINVLKLKRLVEKLFRISQTEKLAYVTPEHPDVTFFLDDDQKEISHYDIKSGDTILIC